jgi:hypothetical protein
METDLGRIRGNSINYNHQFDSPVVSHRHSLNHNQHQQFMKSQEQHLISGEGGCGASSGGRHSSSLLGGEREERGGGDCYNHGYGFIKFRKKGETGDNNRTNHGGVGGGGAGVNHGSSHEQSDVNTGFSPIFKGKHILKFDGKAATSSSSSSSGADEAACDIPSIPPDYYDYDSDYWEDERQLLRWQARRCGLPYFGMEELEKHTQSFCLNDEEKLRYLMR